MDERKGSESERDAEKRGVGGREAGSLLAGDERVALMQG